MWTFVALSLSLSMAAAFKPRCDGTPNAIPLHTADPVFVRRVENGARYVGGSGNDTFYVTHVYGSWYDMGYAQGKLYKEEIPKVFTAFDVWMANRLRKHLPFIPEPLAEIIMEFGLDVALDAVYNATAPFTPNHFLDELRGIADGADVDVMKVMRINLFPELIKAACTIFGANGPATAASTGGSIVHLRALDFDPDSPLVDFASMTVYHPPAHTGLPATATFGWLTMVGALTGLSSRVVGVGEKHWGPKNESAISSWHGTPWMYLLRDVLMAPNISAAEATLRNAHRTCPIHFGVGDATTNTFLGFEVAARYFKVFTDRTKTPYPEHPYFPGIVYWEKSEPSHSFCLADLVNRTYGNISAEWTVLTLAAMAQTGDMHTAAFDYRSKVAFYAVARKSWDTAPSSPLAAYARQFTRLDLNKLFELDG